MLLLPPLQLSQAPFNHLNVLRCVRRLRQLQRGQQRLPTESKITCRNKQGREQRRMTEGNGWQVSTTQKHAKHDRSTTCITSQRCHSQGKISASMKILATGES